MILIIIFLSALAYVVKVTFFTQNENKPQIITESSLYKVINVSNLSTYQCIYNDICTVPQDDNSEEIAYYCSYEAKVCAGVEFDKIQIDVIENEDKNIIKVTIPPVTITDVNVDISSLDFMFIDDDVNESGLSEKAYKICITDVEAKSNKEDKIYDLAQKNAENIIKALINPFIENLNTSDVSYELEIVSSTKSEYSTEVTK